jgi:hypothetical protein
MNLLVRTGRKAQHPFFTRNNFVGDRIDNKVANRYRSQFWDSSVNSKIQ